MKTSLLPLLCALVAPGLAGAQGVPALPSFDLQRLRLESSGLGSLVVGTGRTLDRGVLRVSVQAHYEHLPLHLARSWEPGVSTFGLVENKLSGHLTAAVGVLPGLQLGMQLPYVLAQTGNRYRGITPPNGQGLDEPLVSVRAAPLRMQDGAPLNLAAELEVGLPVGHAHVLGREAWMVRPGVQLGLMGEGWQAGAEVTALLRPRYDLSAMTGRAGDVVGPELRLGATITSRGANDTATRPEVSVLFNAPLMGGRPSAEVLMGVRKHTPLGLDVYALAGPGLGTAVDMPSFRILAGLTFASGPAD